LNLKRRSFLKGIGIGATAAAVQSVQAPFVWAKGKTITWRLVTAWPKNMSILQTGAERFANQVSAMSQGRLNIQVFAGGEYIGPLEVFDAVSQGRAECGNAASYYWAQKIPAAQWFSTVPFGLKAQEMNTWLLYGGAEKLWEQIYAPFDVVPMLAGNSGVQMGGWFNKEIKSIEDFNGLKMRIPGLGGKVLQRLGTRVVLLPAGDIYQALEKGDINATEWIGPYHDRQMGFHRITHYYYAPGWHEPGTAFEMIFNRSAYDQLSSDLKAIVKAAVGDLNNRILADFEYHNAEAMLQIVKEKIVQLRQFPYSVMSVLEQVSADVLETEAQGDPQAMKAHEAFKQFKNDMAKYGLLRGDGIRI